MHSLISFHPRSLVSLLFVLFSSRCSRVTAFTQCYYPDGSIPTDYVWEPCTGAEFSSCCIPSEGDVCQENGLCWYPNGHVFRGTCTDRTWNDPACPKDICVTGQEDTWVWSTPCSDGGEESYACGTIDSGFHVTANCTGAATELTNFRTSASTSKPTRYTSPPAVDTSLYSVYTSTYTTIVSADVQTTTFATTWESTITSTLSRTKSIAGNSATGTSTTSSGENTGTAVPINNSNSNGKLTISAGVLAGAIAGPILILSLLAFLFFFIRKKRALKKAAGTRLDSPPPANGPVGRDQVIPYEIPASESRTGISGVGDKHVYTGTTRRAGEAEAYEMSSQGEKGWAAGGQGAVAEVHGDNWRTGSGVANVGGGVRSPAPVYSESAVGPVVMPVELDGSDSFKGGRGGR